MRKLSIITFSITLSLLVFLIGCGESGDVKVAEIEQIIDEPVIVSPTPIKSVSLAGLSGKFEKNKVKLAGKVVTSRAVVNDSFSNAKGSIRHSIGSANVLGNITLGVKAEDPEGIKAIALYLPNTNRSFNVCSNTCADNSLITVTGFDPQLAGEPSGNLRIELIVSDVLDNQTLADSININWQPITISSISAVRANGNIELSWSGAQSVERFNIYAATEPTLTKDNALSLANGSQLLALSDTSAQLPDMDEDKPYYILITGINNSGESGMSSPLMVPSNNIPINLLPIASPDQFQLTEDQSFSANVLDNDSDPENGAIKIHSVSSQPNNGVLSLQDSGVFAYTPKPNFFGEDSFVYVITDDQGQQADALVTLTIDSVNDTPVALNDTYSLTENRDIVVSSPGILGNDSDIDGDNLTVASTLITQPQFGRLNHNSDGSFTYLANNDFDLSDSFSYQVEDAQGGGHSAIVIILSDQDIASPEAKNDTYQTNEDITLIVDTRANGLLGNDRDPNGFDIHLDQDLITQPLHGQLNLSLDGTFTYIPDSDYVGNDQFQYQITSAAQKSAQATVIINVLAQPDAPNAVDDNYQLIEDQPLFVDASNGLLNNDSDPDGGDFFVNVIALEAPTKGSVILQADGSFEYIPNTNFNGVDQFTYQITNQHNLTNQARVTLTVTASGDAPIAIDDFASTTQGIAITIDALTNDINIDGDNLSIQSAAVDKGVVTIIGSKLTYQPDTNFSGVAFIEYSVSNSVGLTDNGKVTVTVINETSLNNLPSANDDSYTVNEDAQLNASSLLANDSDADNDLLTVQTTPVSNVSHGNLSLLSDGTFSYLPITNFNGSDSFVYSVSDGHGGFAQATVSIIVNAVNDQPIALDDVVSVAENATLSGVSVLANDSDPDNDPLSVSTTPVLDVKNGNLTLKSDGSYVYTATPTFNGIDSFIYQVNDGQGGSAQAKVSITINSTNIAPVATNDSYIVDENASLNASTVLANDVDPNNDALTVLTNPVVDASNGQLSLATDGTFIYTPDPNFDGSDNFVYAVSDPEGATSQATVTITIKNNATGPVAFDDSYIVISLGGKFKANVLDNDFTPEEGHLHVNETPVVDVKNGVLSKLDKHGGFHYTPNFGFIGTDSFVYEIYDDENEEAGTSQATVTFLVVL